MQLEGTGNGERRTGQAPRWAVPLLVLSIVLFPVPRSPIPAAQAQPVSVTDDRGKLVALAQPAQRIVALAPGLAELAFAAGAGARLVGVSRLSDYPAEVRGLPQVGDAVRLDFEMIAALHPDLVLAWRSGNAPADVARLEQLGPAAYVSEARRLADIPRHLRALGALAGTEAAAERAAAAFESGVDELRRRYAGAAPVRVFYEVWRRPIMTVGGAHLVSDLITLCGGQNVFAETRSLAPTLSAEALLAAKPEAVLGGTRGGGEERYAADWRAQAPEPLRALPVFYVDPDLVQRPGPRLVEGAKAVCEALDRARAQRAR